METVFYRDVGFRAIYNHFCCFKKEGILLDIAKNYLPHNSDSDCILTYGYIDHYQGLSVEILACGCELSDNKFRFSQPNQTVRTHARIEAIESIPFTIMSFESLSQAELYTEKLHNIKMNHSVNEEIEKSRTFNFLDSSRNKYFIDDVLVLFRKNRTVCDKRWVRIEGLNEHSFKGKLLEEPDKMVPFHKNDLVEFAAIKNSNNSIFCVSDIS